MEKTINIHLAAKLYNLRRQRDLKQEEVASALKLSQQAYSLYERGATNFNDEFVDSVCQFYKISTSDFFSLPSSLTVTNSPNSVSANINSTVNNTKVLDEIMPLLLEEIKSNRIERTELLTFIKNQAESNSKEKELLINIIEKIKAK